MSQRIIRKDLRFAKKINFLIFRDIYNKNKNYETEQEQQRAKRDLS